MIDRLLVTEVKNLVGNLLLHLLNRGTALLPIPLL
jgi:hypothetical protein